MVRQGYLGKHLKIQPLVPAFQALLHSGIGKIKQMVRGAGAQKKDA
jgi:hypothetical protein